MTHRPLLWAVLCTLGCSRLRQGALNATETDGGTDARTETIDATETDGGTDARTNTIDAVTVDVGSDACAQERCACASGQRRVGDACVAENAVVRPIGPISLGDVTQRRPTLRWELPTGFDGAVVELCRDRSCTTVIESLTAEGSTVRPTRELAPRSVVFWRLRGRIGKVTDTRQSPTWLFHTPAVSAPSGVDTSVNPHLDVNGDGYDDLVVGAPQRMNETPDGGHRPGSVRVFHGSATGVSQTPSTTLDGPAMGDNFGIAVTGAGDLNGDGFADLVVSAAFANDEAGEVSVFLGGTAGVSPSARMVLEGDRDGAHFGWSVAAAGDVNRDGYGDFIVGTLNASPGGRDSAGTVSVFHGSATTVTPTPVRVLEGSAAGDLSSWSISGAGDVNGDGYSDVVVGAIAARGTGAAHTGTAGVFLGTRMSVSTSASTELQGRAMGDYFGFAVSVTGDVNGDGYSDVVVGAPVSAPGGRENAGSVSVFHGNVSGVSTTPQWVYEGHTVNDRLGWSVASAGDTNGDGYTDLVLGAATASSGGRMSAGTAGVFLGIFSGVSGSATRWITGSTAGDQLGYSVASAGDVNGDGFADIVLGAPHASANGSTAAGLAYVFHGNASGVSSTAARVLSGGTVNGNFGFSVASAIELDGYGRWRWWCWYEQPWSELNRAFTFV